MHISLNITGWLLSVMLTDLTQTADFTAIGKPELNPLVKQIVEPKTNYGEIGLGIIGSSLAIHPGVPDKIKILWAIGHTWG